jgi:hypothetical protein
VEYANIGRIWRFTTVLDGVVFIFPFSASEFTLLFGAGAGVVDFKGDSRPDIL